MSNSNKGRLKRIAAFIAALFMAAGTYGCTQQKMKKEMGKELGNFREHLAFSEALKDDTENYKDQFGPMAEFIENWNNLIEKYKNKGIINKEGLIQPELLLEDIEGLSNEEIIKKINYQILQELNPNLIDENLLSNFPMFVSYSDDKGGFELNGKDQVAVMYGIYNIIIAFNYPEDIEISIDGVRGNALFDEFKQDIWNDPNGMDANKVSKSEDGNVIYTIQWEDVDNEEKKEQIKGSIENFFTKYVNRRFMDVYQSVLNGEQSNCCVNGFIELSEDETSIVINGKKYKIFTVELKEERIGAQIKEEVIVNFDFAALKAISKGSPESLELPGSSVEAR